MSGLEDFAKVAAVASALGGAAEGVRAQEILDESDKNAVMHEVLPVLEEGGMKKIGEGKYQMEHNGVVLEITIPVTYIDLNERKETARVEERKVEATVEEKQVIVGVPKEFSDERVKVELKTDERVKVRLESPETEVIEAPKF